MKVLKSLVLSLLSLILFFSLSIFGIAFTLNSTLLNADFVVSEIDKIDMPAVTKELTDMLITPQLPQEMRFLKDAISGAVADFAPSLKEQLKAGINASYGYFLGKSQRLSLSISLEPLKTGLRDRMRQAFMQSIPPQLSGLPPAQVDQYFNQVYQQFSQQMPSSFTIDESSLGPQTMAQVRQVKQYLGYFQLGYWALIGFMALLITGIILINRNIRRITRELGVNFLIYGALGWVLGWGGNFLVNNYVPASLALPGISPALQSWLLQLMADIVAPQQVFGVVLVALGIILTIISFIYKPRPAAAPSTGS